MHEPKKARPINRVHNRIKVSRQCKQASAKSMPMHDPPEGNSTKTHKALTKNIKTAKLSKSSEVHANACTTYTTSSINSKHSDSFQRTALILLATSELLHVLSMLLILPGSSASSLFSSSSADAAALPRPLQTPAT